MATNFVQLLKNRVFLNKINLGYYSSSVKNLPKSSLFISGARAVDTFVVVIPLLDFDERFGNLPELEENVKRRRLDLNVLELKQSWDFYKDWNKKKVQLQENLNQTGIRMSELEKMEESKEKIIEIENIERYRKLLKEGLHDVRQNVWDMEDNVISKLLLLPNVLHTETPDKEEELFKFNQENIKDGYDHLLKGVELDCLDYQNELTCFLKNEAAVFELVIPELFVDKFVEEGFMRFSNPDFARSVLAEGVGVAPGDISELFLLENSESNNDLLHLCGGASLFPFCGFHAKQSVPKQSLPVKYIASGRQYNPVTYQLPGLYSVKQSASVQIFIATCNEEEIYQEFQSCLKNLQEIYSDLGLKFKVVKQPPYCLKRWESLRVSILVFSPFQQVFVEVGNVSLIDDFISKRLRMCYTDKKDELYLKVVSGTVINTQTLLALCLERSHSNLLLPNVVKDYMI